MKIKKISFILSILASLVLVAGCISDPGVNKKRGKVIDFSLTNSNLGCGKDLLILSQPDTCTTSCGEGTHKASTAELTQVKTENASDTNLIAKITASAGICVPDTTSALRPTNAIDIKSDICSCINGKSDIISDCASFCANTTPSASPTLYLNTIMGSDVALNPKLGNLYNWCSVQLEGDPTAPQCFLSARDGNGNVISNIAVTVNPGSNSLTANIQQLALDKTYIVKIIEGKTGTNAQSKEIQIRRKTQSPDDSSSQVGTIKVTPINQYTCVSYLGTIAPDGSRLLTAYKREFYYFAANETPSSMPPLTAQSTTIVVCHDDQLHPGADSSEYPRLELIPGKFALWDRADQRFYKSDGATRNIDKTITNRLLTEYGITGKINLFLNVGSPSDPLSSNSVFMGYMMVPWVDNSGKAFCPTQTQFNGTDPTLNILKDYMDDTEGLYISQKEPETISGVTFWGTMLINESIIKKYGFYIENGIKILATPSAMHTKTISFYWPVSETMDPLLQGNRKLFTVRSYDTLNGRKPTTDSNVQTTSDKRIGCIPKSK